MPPKRKQKFTATKRPTSPKPNMVRRQIIVGVLLVLFISLIITGIYYISRIESEQIKGVEVTGGQTISHNEIKQIVERELLGHYYRLVPKTFTWTYPQNTIAKQVLKNDRVKNVEVALKKQIVVVVFEEYVPFALWCTETDEHCLFMDRQGLAFAQAPELSGGAFVRYAQSNQVPEKGVVGFSGEFLPANEAFIEQLQDELGLYVTHVTKAGDYDLQYRVSGGGVIKISQTMELDQSFRNLRSILQSEEFVHLEPGKFQYIDLRFGDKVFVNEAVPSNSPATSTISSDE